MKLEYDIKLEENDAQIASALADKVRLILTAWGIAIQNYAVKLVPVGTPESTGIEGYTGGTLKQSITYEVDTAQKRVIVGSNVPYSVYVELGTGIYAENGDGRKTSWVWKDKNGKWLYKAIGKDYNVSEYATKEILDRRCDEAYTEYRTKLLLTK